MACHLSTRVGDATKATDLKNDIDSGDKIDYGSASVQHLVRHAYAQLAQRLPALGISDQLPWECLDKKTTVPSHEPTLASKKFFFEAHIIRSHEVQDDDGFPIQVVLLFDLLLLEGIACVWPPMNEELGILMVI